VLKERIKANRDGKKFMQHPGVEYIACVCNHVFIDRLWSECPSSLYEQNQLHSLSSWSYLNGKWYCNKYSSVFTVDQGTGEFEVCVEAAK